MGETGLSPRDAALRAMSDEELHARYQQATARMRRLVAEADARGNPVKADIRQILADADDLDAEEAGRG